jgi:hypothetical protein
MDAPTTGTVAGGKHHSASWALGDRQPRDIRKSLVERARRAHRQLAENPRANRPT